MCSTVFVLPPMAMSRTIELSIDSAVTISRGNRPWPGPTRSNSLTISTIRRAAAWKSTLRSLAVASKVPLVGSAMPRASQRQFMLLAVNMPEQDPQVGQAAFSRASNSAADSLSFCLAAAPMKTSIRSTVLPSAVLPASIGPPLTKTVGILQRMAPMSMPGTILSQLGMQTMPSKQWACEHRLHGVGNHLAAGQRILHARVSHGDAVVHADRVEDERHAAGRADALLDVDAHLVQMDVAGNDVGIAVANGDERLAEIVVGHAGGAEQAAVRCAGIAQFDNVGTHVRKYPESCAEERTIHCNPPPGEWVGGDCRRGGWKVS